MVIEDAVARIRAQETLDDVLAYLESTDKSWNATWAVRQACRHGASRERIRTVVFSLLSDPGDDSATRRKASALVRVCDELGILEQQDAENSPVIAHARVENAAIESCYEGGLGWAIKSCAGGLGEGKRKRGSKRRR